MVYRDNPKCDLCGEDIPAVFRESPTGSIFIGDTFSHWDFKGHNEVCKEAKLIAPQQPQSDGEQKCAFCGWKKKDHRLNCCYHYSDEDTDYFYKDKFFKAMTQSDAPKLCDGCNVRGNWEHRCHGGDCKCINPVCMEVQGQITHEQLMKIVTADAPNEGREEKHECEFFLVTDVAVYACECERIEVSGKTYYPEEDINALHYRLTDLRDQLSKERETTEQIKKSFGQIIHDLKIDLQKEREMKKDLVNHLSELLSDYKNHCVWLDFEERTEAILAKASELDKNE